MSDGFVADLLEKQNQFFKVAFEQFKIDKKISGTKVLVTRFTEVSRYKAVYGTLYNSALQGDIGKETFEYVVNINMNDMLRLYQRTINQLEFYDNQNILKMGDTLSYERAGNLYQFKISSVDTWSDDNDILFKYTLVGLKESKTLANENSEKDCR